MYKLEFFPYEINGIKIKDDFDYIKTSFIPRNDEIIEGIKVCVANDDKGLDDYLLNVKVEKVHYKVFDDNSSIPVVYGRVINFKKVESDE